MLFVVGAELSRVFHGYEPRLQSRVVLPTCPQRQISENQSKDPLPQLFRDPPTENEWHFEGDYTSDQMKSMIWTNHQHRSPTRLGILSGQGENLSTHSQQDNKPSLPTVCQNTSDASGDQATMREFGWPSRGDKASGRRANQPIGQTDGILLGDCWQTVGRPVTDDPAMTDPATDDLIAKATANSQNRAPCRQSSMSPCQQSVENPVSRVSLSVDNPFVPAVEINDIAPTGCSS